MRNLLIVFVLLLPTLVCADSVPIQDRTTLPCDNSSNNSCSTSNTTNSAAPSAGQANIGTNTSRPIESVTKENRDMPSNSTVTPVPQPNTPPPVNAVPSLTTPISPSGKR